MNKSAYRKLCQSSRWDDYFVNIKNILKNHSCTIATLPSFGKSTVLKILYDEIKDDPEYNSIVVITEVLNSINKESIEKELLALVSAKYKLIEVNDLKTACEILTSESKGVIFIINLAENLIGRREVLDFFETIRHVDPNKIKFLFGIDLTVFVDSKGYSSNGVIMFANILTLPALSKDETFMSLEGYRDIYSWDISKDDYVRYFELSGGIPGLLKYLASESNKKQISIYDLEGEILKNNVMLIKVKQIFEKIDIFLSYKPSSSIKDKIFQEIGLFDNKNSYVSSLLDAYANTLKSQSENQEELTATEEKIFALFKEIPNKTVSLEQISQILWSNSQDIRYSQWAIYKQISNLNKKLQSQNLTIKNKRGKGYLLKSVV